ncbi:hypothetical protein BH10PLA2_BH10PLA2_15070 [soil metagenome]
MLGAAGLSLNLILLGVLEHHHDRVLRRPACFSGHEDAVWSVALSPNGRTLASGSRDKTASLWDVATRKTIGMLTGYNNWLR